MPGDETLKIAGVVFYFGILIAIGVVAARRMKNLRDYMVAGKNVGFLAAAFSSRATGESAWLLLGLTGMGAFVGVHAFWVVIGEVLGVGGAWILLSRRFKRLTDHYDSVTVPDFLESRFRDETHALRWVAGIALVVFVTIYVSAQIHATGQAFDNFLGWNYYVGAIVGFAVVLAYTTFGGFVAVVWSDVFQGSMMFLGLTLLPLGALITTGGIGPVIETLQSENPALLEFWHADLRQDDGSVMRGVASTLSLLCIGIGFLGSPQIFVRFIALRSEKEITRGTWVALTWTLFADTGAVLIGLIAASTFGVENLGSGGELALPQLVVETLPAILVGLYIAVVLAAVMSTADSLLIVASSAAIRDVYQKILHPELDDASLVKKSRVATLVIALVALAVAMAVALTTGKTTIFWYVVFGWSGIAATFCPTLILALFWRGVTRRGAISGMTVGFLGVPYFAFFAPKLAGEWGVFFKNLGELTPAFVLSGIVAIVVSSVDRKGARRLEDTHAEIRRAGTGE